MYVITGATARTGGAIARDLLSHGLPVRAISRSAEKLKPLAELGAETYVADPRDRDAMADAFVGATAVWAMLQPNYIPDSPDFRRFQSEIIEAMLPALERGRPGHIVSLSSWSADLSSGNGPVAGMHDLEQALNGLEHSDVLHLRAGYFMENSLGYIDPLRRGDTVSGPFDPAVPMPWVGTADIAAAAAAHLRLHDFGHRAIHELHGPQDFGIEEALRVIAEALSRPGIRYARIPFDAARRDFLEQGMSESVADMMIEVADSINNGIIRFNEPRSPANSSPTTFETFVETTWLPAYRARESA
jgi:uncharacterized protein YbjT (DUF2867 family)